MPAAGPLGAPRAGGTVSGLSTMPTSYRSCRFAPTPEVRGSECPGAALRRSADAGQHQELRGRYAPPERPPGSRGFWAGPVDAEPTAVAIRRPRAGEVRTDGPRGIRGRASPVMAVGAPPEPPVTAAAARMPSHCRRVRPVVDRGGHRVRPCHTRTRTSFGSNGSGEIERVGGVLELNRKAVRVRLGGVLGDDAD